MRILLYEFVTGGGWHLVDPAEPPSGSLLAEGTAMRNALAADLAVLPGQELSLLRDLRLPAPVLPGVSLRQIHEVGSAAEHLSTLLAAAQGADATLVIAPEFDGHLFTLVRALEAAGVKLLSPAAEFVALTSDKHRTAEHLAAAGVPTPRGALFNSLAHLTEHSPALPCPAVLKPNDGAGSLRIRRIDRAEQYSALREEKVSGAWRCETLLPGRAASVAVLCGPAPLPCPACWQFLSSDGAFTYLGGERIMHRALAERAEALALRAINALPPTSGYVGLDLILAEAQDGSADAVIEVNPRLTTSYVGLRHMTSGNLASAMLRVGSGQAPDLCWNEHPIQFEADGTWR